MRIESLPDLAEYREIGHLGKGGFGAVTLIEGQAGKKALKEYFSKLGGLKFIEDAVEFRYSITGISPEDFVAPESGGYQKRWSDKLKMHLKRLCVVMNYIEGKTFFEVMESEKSGSSGAVLPEFDIPYFGEEDAERDRVLRGIESIRSYVSLTVEKLMLLVENGVAHRDIRPENVMRRQDGTVALIDFDLLRRINQPFQRDDVFSLDYNAAPEYIDDYRRRLTSTSDMYSLGMTAMKLLYGESFFSKLDPSMAVDSGESDLFAKLCGRLVDRVRSGIPLTESSFVSERIRRDLVRTLPEDVRCEVHGLVEFAIAALNRNPGARPKNVEEVRQLLAERPNVGMYYGPASLGK